MCFVILTIIALAINILLPHTKAVDTKKTVIVKITTAKQNTILWKAPTASFSTSDMEDIETALQSSLSQPVPSEAPVTGMYFTIFAANRDTTWASFYASTSTTLHGLPLATDPLFFIAHYANSIWSVSQATTPGFCNEIGQMPKTLLNGNDGWTMYCPTS